MSQELFEYLNRIEQRCLECPACKTLAACQLSSPQADFFTLYSLHPCHNQLDKAMIKAARDAISIQDASNMGGVVNLLQQIVHYVLYPESRRRHQGTQWVNQHPVVRLICDKISDLSRHRYTDFSEYWDYCSKVMNSNCNADYTTPTTTHNNQENHVVETQPETQP